MTRIYTRRGDAGETSLFGGGRVPKSDLRVEAYGTVDELNAVLGWALREVETEEAAGALRTIQHDLFSLGATLATPPDVEGDERAGPAPGLPEERVEEMEGWIDDAVDEVGPLRHFIVPGGAPGAAALHVARTVCRRAERAAVALASEEPVQPGILRYLNRLSDLLFVHARLENHRCEIDDVAWEKPGSG